MSCPILSYLSCGRSSIIPITVSTLNIVCLSLSPSPHTVILADSIRNYMSKFLSDAWMYENGFVDEKVHQFSTFISTSSLLILLFMSSYLQPIFLFSAFYLSASSIYETFFLFICHLHLLPFLLLFACYAFDYASWYTSHYSSRPTSNPCDRNLLSDHEP
jgi:hypothetical protein